jgi:hypothetical protein
VFQEYPTIPEEAFLTTWNPFFNTEKLKALKSMKWKADLKYKDLIIYKEAHDDCLYGVDTSMWWINGDLSVVTIRNRNLELLACYIWSIPPDMLAEVILYIYDLWYKTKGATIWIEINNTWISTIDKLKDTKLNKYLYAQRVIDERTQKRSRKLWFNTNMKTRPLILNWIEEAIREESLIEIDDRAKSDFFHFIYNDNGRPEALQGKHDDCVMADAICIFMLNQPKEIIFWN